MSHTDVHIWAATPSSMSSGVERLMQYRSIIVSALTEVTMYSFDFMQESFTQISLFAAPRLGLSTV